MDSILDDDPFLSLSSAREAAQAIFPAEILLDRLRAVLPEYLADVISSLGCIDPEHPLQDIEDPERWRSGATQRRWHHARCTLSLVNREQPDAGWTESHDDQLACLDRSHDFDGRTSLDLLEAKSCAQRQGGSDGGYCCRLHHAIGALLADPGAAEADQRPDGHSEAP